MKPISGLKLDRSAVLEEWFGCIVDTYPKVTATFLARERDRFGNPVGHAIGRAIGPIYDQVISDMDEAVLRNALDEVLRIRSVQSFEASAAVGFVFGLKPVIRAAAASPDPSVLAEIDERIDRVALLAFDCYTRCREQLHDIRANEIRARSVRLLERAGLAPAAVGHEKQVNDREK